MSKTCIYVSCAESRVIDVLALDPRSGEVSLRQRLATAGSPLPMRISPDRRVLLVGTRSENALLSFAIDPDRGELSPLGSVPAPGGPTYVSCDRGMRVAFVASYGDNNLSVFPLAANGAPQPACQLETELPRAHAALMDASNRWLLVPTLGADAIRVYRLEEEVPRLTPNVPAMIQVRGGSGPRHLVFSPDNRHVHCLNELDGSIDLFDFDSLSGTLILRQSIGMMPPDFDGQPWAAELRATPDGRFLYATDRRSSMLAVFAVDAQTRQLSLSGHHPTETQPRGMAVDPSGRWLVVAGELSGHVSVYEIDPGTGCPSLHSRHATGKDPICVEIVAL